MIESPIQREILSNCSFFQAGARYAQLKPKKIDNDLFNYHLQFLVKQGYLLKQEQEALKLYFLTEKGKSIVTNIHEDSKEISQNYKVSVYLCPVVGDQVLLYRRLKHPQYGYVGLISGKIKYGENILQTATREFTEECGLKGDFKIIGNLRQIRKNNKGKVIEDGVFYVCYTDQVQGKLIEKNIEGEYFWIPIKKAPKIEKIFKPSLEAIIKEVQQRLSGKIPWGNQFIYEFEPEPEEY